IRPYSVADRSMTDAASAGRHDRLCNADSLAATTRHTSWSKLARTKTTHPVTPTLILINKCASQFDNVQASLFQRDGNATTRWLEHTPNPTKAITVARTGAMGE